MVKTPEVWAWSSYRVTMGFAQAEPFLVVDGLLAQFAQYRAAARERYAQFVREGITAPSPWLHLRSQVFLGYDNFVSKTQSQMAAHQHDAVQIPTAQCCPPVKALQQIEGSSANRNAAIVEAHATGAYSYQQITEYFGIHFTTVGRVVRNGS